MVVIACRSASGTSPSSSISACTTWHWKALKTPSAPTYDGASQITTSPGSQNTRVTRSTACWEPTVTTTSSGCASMPSRAITSQICSRSVGSPWPEEYCSATGPRWATSSAIAAPTTSSGSPLMFGIPPASETTSGREATANSARISEAVIPCVRAAYRST